MAKDYYENFSLFREIIQEASDTLSWDFKKLCFEENQGLELTQKTQPSLFTVSYGIFKVLKSLVPLEIQAMAGHSLGEYSALASAGAWKFTDALKIVSYRGKVMSESSSGGMLAYLGSQRDKVFDVIQDIKKYIVEPANDNGPQQLILSGHSEGLKILQNKIHENKLGKGIFLNVSGPFHSSLMNPAAALLKEYLKSYDLNPIQYPIYSNVDTHKYEKTYSKDLLIQQMTKPVLWREIIQNLVKEDSESQFIEIGPGKVLQGLTKKICERSVLITDKVLDIRNIEKLWLN